MRCSSIRPAIFHAFSTFYIISQLRVTENIGSQSDVLVPNAIVKIFMFMRARAFSGSSPKTRFIICMTLSSRLEPKGSFRKGTLIVYIGGEIFGNGGS